MMRANLFHNVIRNCNITDNVETGISVGGSIINTTRYADDKEVVANSQKVDMKKTKLDS